MEPDNQLGSDSIERNEINPEKRNPDSTSSTPDANNMSISPAAQKIVEYLMRAVDQAQLLYQPDVQVPQGIISLSNPEFLCKRRDSHSAPPMTIPQFNEWVVQTGLETLRIGDITLWRARRVPYHEFIMVTLQPFPTFQPKALPTPDSPLHSFNLEENVKHGLGFRIDRGGQGKRIARGSGSRVAAVDMVELTNRTTELEGCDACFSLPFKLNVSSPFHEFFSPRVFDILFCLDRATDTFGPKYTVHDRNCWSFATFLFQMMRFLFNGVPQQLPTCPSTFNGFIRNRFIGISVDLPFPQILDPPFITPANFCGSPKKSNIVFSNNPFRAIFLRIVGGYLDFLDLKRHTFDVLEFKTIDAATLAMLLAKFQILSSVFFDSGMVTLLRTLVEHHFSTCNCSPLENQVDDPSSMLTVALYCATCAISELVNAMMDKDPVGSAEGIACCIRFVRLHRDRFHLLPSVRLNLLAYLAMSLIKSKDSIKIVVDAGALDIIKQAFASKSSDWECVLAFAALIAVARSDEQSLRKTEGLARIVREAFSRMLSGLSNKLAIIYKVVMKLKWSTIHLLLFEWDIMGIIAKFLNASESWRRWEVQQVAPVQRFFMFSIIYVSNLFHRNRNAPSRFLSSLLNSQTNLMKVALEENDGLMRREVKKQTKLLSVMFLMEVGNAWGNEELPEAVRSSPSHNNEQQGGEAIPGNPGNNSVDGDQVTGNRTATSRVRKGRKVVNPRQSENLMGADIIPTRKLRKGLKI